MSTRSNIAVENPDGSVRAIYCHHDGYPEGVGRTLATYYKTEEQINELLNLGNISSLGETPAECIAYGGENEKAITYENRDELIASAEESIIEYLYLNVDGDWFVFDVFPESQWKSLSNFT